MEITTLFGYSRLNCGSSICEAFKFSHVQSAKHSRTRGRETEAGLEASMTHMSRETTGKEATKRERERERERERKANNGQ